MIKDNLKVEALQYITGESSRQERFRRFIKGEIEDKNSEIEMIQMELDKNHKAMKKKDEVIEKKDKTINELKRESN